MSNEIVKGSVGQNAFLRGFLSWDYILDLS